MTIGLNPDDPRTLEEQLEALERLRPLGQLYLPMWYEWRGLLRTAIRDRDALVGRV